MRQALAEEADHRQALESLVIVCLQDGRREVALEELQKLVAAYPEDPQVCDRLNTLSDALGQPGLAIDAYRRLLEMRPELTNSRYNLAHLLRRNGRAAEAIDEYQYCLEQGVANPAEVHTNLSVIYTEAGRDEEAEAELNKALALDECHVAAIYNLGLLCEERGEWSRAHSLFLRVLENDPDYTQAMVRLADGERHGDPTSRVSRKIKRALARDGLSQEEREQLHYALGKIYDDCAQYDDAMINYSRANELSRKRVTGYRVADQEKFFDTLCELTAEDLEAIPHVSEEAPIFICGMFRSGTTLLEQVLAAHPALQAGGELSYFRAALKEEVPALLGSWDDSRWTGLAKGYMERLQELGLEPGKTTDKRPDNFLYLGLIKRLFPNARFLHTVRNPLDTCLSIFFQPLEAQIDYANDIKHIGHYYLQYRRLLDHWATLLGDSIMHVPYELLVQEPEPVIRKVLDHLELPWDDACLRFYEADTRVRTASLHQVRQPLYQRSIGRAENYAKYLEPLKAYLDDALSASQ